MGIKTQTIEYKQGDTVCEGYLAYDDAQKNERSGVLVVHEWKGLDSYAQKRTEMLAQLGYVAFAADIFGKGIRPETVPEAIATIGKYRADRALLRARVNAAFDVLKSQPNVDASRLAAIGFCFGGTAALELGRSGANIQGIVSFHGGLSTPAPQDAKNIKAKVLILHGADDASISNDDLVAFEKEMKDAKVDYRFIKYPGAQHGFSNPHNTGTTPGVLYNEAADKASWLEMQKFFKEIFGI